jgi:hypothetical protein
VRQKEQEKKQRYEGIKEERKVRVKERVDDAQYALKA